MSKCYAQHTTHQQCIFETFSRINNSRQSKNGVGAGTKCQSAAQMIQFPNNSSTLTLDCRNSSGKVGKTKNSYLCLLTLYQNSEYRHPQTGTGFKVWHANHIQNRCGTPLIMSKTCFS